DAIRQVFRGVPDSALDMTKLWQGDASLRPLMARLASKTGQTTFPDAFRQLLKDVEIHFVETESGLFETRPTSRKGDQAGVALFRWEGRVDISGKPHIYIAVRQDQTSVLGRLPEQSAPVAAHEIVHLLIEELMRIEFSTVQAAGWSPDRIHELA